MDASATSSPLDDVEYLARSAHRVTALTALTKRPRSRDELLSLTGVSPSTMRRTLRAFEERRWVHRRDGRYEATELGAFVTAGLTQLLDRLETERLLRDTWELLPTEERGFTVGMWSDAVVTTAASENPYRPVNRFLSLLGTADRFRLVGFDLAVLEPCLADICDRVIDGADAEIIEAPAVVESLRSTYPERSARALNSGNLVVRTHDDLPPYGFGVFGDRVAVTGYDAESGTVRVIIDTDAPEAREWVKSRFERYRQERSPLALESPGGR
ncbi:MarR family transcriptional regulator [Haloarcula sp. S1CR25-12]|uniref:MarR family transcriptional regulator n=1 Tax=Haloarcula saliterrae TaxID=2950534 RepID=A0ABU2F8Y0_9EURY|nr:MarR family transcriptional regulator [Haloarcula sp. S1CR25-12]MDS0258295.1 MarR family transcriptional regulator [Haloarcula sp. S1CR25-12]